MTRINHYFNQMKCLKFIANKIKKKSDLKIVKILIKEKKEIIHNINKVLKNK